MGDLSGCDPDYLFGLNVSEVKKKFSEIIAKNNFTELGSYYHRFDNNSFTGVVALSESHVSIHTWPELGIVNMDVYTCDYQRSNAGYTRNMFDEIAQLFRPAQIKKKELRR